MDDTWLQALQVRRRLHVFFLGAFMQYVVRTGPFGWVALKDVEDSGPPHVPGTFKHGTYTLNGTIYKVYWVDYSKVDERDA